MSEVQELFVEMFVVGLVLDPASNAPIVILKDETGNICLPIWIGLAEATAIASALKKVEMGRPMTHDLLTDVIDRLGARVLRVVVHKLQDNTFFANVEVKMGSEIKEIDCRPSDALAIAVRVKCPVMVAEKVLKQAQVTLVAVDPGDEEGGGVLGEGSETELAAQEVGGDTGCDFRTIDKDKWKEILAEMDPDDFKYKM